MLRSYSETNLFLAANGVSESYRTPPKDGEESTSETDVEEDDEMNVEEIEREVEKPKRRKEVSFEDGPLDFNFSTAGLRLTGMTTSPAELKAFIAKLTALAVLLPEDADGEE